MSSPVATGLIALGMFIGGARMLKETLAALDESLGMSRAPLAGSGRFTGYCGSGDDKKCRVYDVNKIEDRVHHIGELIRKYSEDPEFIIKARQIVSQRCGNDWCVAPRDYMGEINEVWNFVKHNMRYVRDHATKDTYYNPNANLRSHGGDCDDFVITFGALIRAIGYEFAMVVIRTKNARDFNHIYGMVNASPKGAAKWVPIDASVDYVVKDGRKVPSYPGWEAPASMVAAKRIFRV